MLYVDGETREGVNQKLELQRNILESKGFQISRTKTKYMHCRFRLHDWREIEVRLDGIAVADAIKKF